MEKSKVLSVDQQRALELLLLGRTHLDVAKEVGVASFTLTRWKRLPEFKQALEEVRAAAFDGLVESINALTDEAVATISEMMRDRDTPPQVRLSAARMIVETSIKVRETQQLADEIEAIKARLEAQSHALP